MLVTRKNLAKTSSTPGKTQTINHFIIDDSWYVVDLPGYGYANVGKASRQAWPIMIENYIQNRETLQNTFVLIDSRLEPQANDVDFVNWIGKKQLPFSLVFTKIDKISKGAVSKTAEGMGPKVKTDVGRLAPGLLYLSGEKNR